MSDLSDEQLEGMGMWDHDPAVFQERSRPIWAMLVRSLVAETRRHRAAQAADEERARSVVEEVAALTLSGCLTAASWRSDVDDIARRIATRVAKQLAGAKWTPPIEHPLLIKSREESSCHRDDCWVHSDCMDPDNCPGRGAP